LSTSGALPVSLDDLYREHAQQVRNVVARICGPGIDPEDLVQEVFIVAHRRQAEFSAGLPPGWIYGVAVKVATASRRRSRIRQFFGVEAAEAIPASETPASAFEKAEASRLVYAVLDKMSEKKRTVFVLYELEGLSGEEIAQAVGCPLKTVWTRLFHARKEFAERVRKTQARQGTSLGKGPHDE
jgi:RNA polymerase sigma-70 factor (ECF subfamily)